MTTTSAPPLAGAVVLVSTDTVIGVMAADGLEPALPQRRRLGAEECARFLTTRGFLLFSMGLSQGFDFSADVESTSGDMVTKDALPTYLMRLNDMARWYLRAFAFILLLFCAFSSFECIILLVFRVSVVFTIRCHLQFSCRFLFSCRFSVPVVCLADICRFRVWCPFPTFCGLSI